MLKKYPQKFTSYRQLIMFGIIAILGLAGGAFFFLQSSSDIIETDLLLPINPSTLKPGLSIAKINHDVIEVRVRGPEPIIQLLPDQKKVYDMDLAHLGVGTHTLPVQAARIGFVEDIAVLAVDPQEITLTIEKEMQKQLPVLIKFKGDPAPNYYISDKIVKPSRVPVVGPQSFLAPINELMTKPIDVKGITESFRKETALSLPEGITLLHPLDPIMVDIAVREKQVEKQFNAIPVKGKNSPYTFSLTPQNVSITIKGPISQLDHLDPFSSINVYIDLKDLQPGIYVRRATISLPVNLVLVGIKPENFTAIVNKNKNP